MIAGLVYNPVTDEMFIAERGKGAFLNEQRIRVAGRKRLADAVVACGLPHLGRGDLALGAPGDRRHAGAGRRLAPLRRRRARSRLGRRRPVRRLLGAQHQALGHGGRDDPGARGRRFRQRLRRRRRYVRQGAHRRRQRGHAESGFGGAQTRRQRPDAQPQFELNPPLYAVRSGHDFRLSSVCGILQFRLRAPGINI